MLLTTLLITSTAINIVLAILIFKSNVSKKDLQFKVKAIQGWAEEAYKKIKKLEETRNSLLEHVSNLDVPEKKNGARKKTRRSSKKK